MKTRYFDLRKDNQEVQKLDNEVFSHDFKKKLCQTSAMLRYGFATIHFPLKGWLAPIEASIYVGHVLDIQAKI